MNVHLLVRVHLGWIRSRWNVLFDWSLNWR